jgi:hypothetical protein
MESPAVPNARDALRGVIDALSDGLAYLRDVLGELEVHAANGVSHLFGLTDQRFALLGETVDQPPDPDLIVAIGAFEARHLVVDEGFEFGGARQRAFHAVAHRSHLAADRLSDADDRLARNSFRLGQANGDLCHRLSDDAQFQ